MRKFLKISGIILAIIVAALLVTYLILDRPLPEGQATERADSLAVEMLQALNQPAWDSTQIITWQSRGNYEYIWDKKRHLVQLQKDDTRTLLNTQSPEDGLVYKDGDRLEEGKASEILSQAWEDFCNDSYWLVAPFKVFDPGTTRKFVHQDEGRPQLLVTYNSGGVTPGDSYLWEIDESGMPQSFRMWVSVIPIGGLKATWENWKTCATGVKLPTYHHMLVAGFDLEEVNAYASLEAAGLERDPFAPLETLQ